ncbi:CoA transferase [Mesorhizobium sp. LHD-90]|uniref:CoA transferase n=1 Tax=Mesorhizobium sp. LHD-90 TaxID=3071414 RepID=UPI0027E19D01|nr:CoA transferase [Mesorhizobium sp. LHD-90]MDQ6436962.1 CoA transferase [Mesorhizobium sp. LHD-90]
MYRTLTGMRVIEASSFVAAPSCGLHLAQMGAEVIRLDLIGGGPDFNRWPRSQDGASLFWEGLNKGKKSIALDLRRPEGRELAAALVSAPGDGGGLFVTNFPAEGFLAHERLAARRADLITVRVMGHANGRQAVDYTVNAAFGFPYMTGPESLGAEPVNHVLPAWDLLAGAHAAFALLAAELFRRASGKGQEIRLPLSDLAAATLGNLGMIAEATQSGTARPRYGNALYGAFGRDFVTSDDKRIMLVAITEGQWSSLINALNIVDEVASLERELGISFGKDEGLRFQHKDRLFAIVEKPIRRASYAELARRLDKDGVCWSPYRSVHEALEEDPVLSEANPIFEMVEHPSGFAYATPGSAASFTGLERSFPPRSPRLGEHTDEVLSEVLGLSNTEINDLHDRDIVA